MITKTVFIAEDGTNFFDEDECLKYEYNLRAQKFINTAFLYDEDGKNLPLTPKDFDSSVYVVAKTEEAAKFMEKSFYGRTPWRFRNSGETGCWAWTNDNWIKAETILNMANIIKQITKEEK